VKFKELYTHTEVHPYQYDDLLVYACKRDSDGIARFLIRKGHDINKADVEELNTPLHYALGNKNFDLVNFLLSKGADERKLNKNDLNPWQLFHSKQFKNYSLI